MKGRTPTKAEKEYMSLVADAGCIVCHEFLGVFTPAAIHHIDGKTKEGAHFNIIPLCPRHHQHPCNHGSWATRHGSGKKAGKKAFEAEYCTESELKKRLERYL